VRPEELLAAARTLGVSLDSSQCEALGEFVGLVEKWNVSFNLVSRKDVGRLWARHVLDSLSILPFLGAPPFPDASREEPGSPPRRLSALDAGTGAGFPGLPLAIADPDIDWLLVDRSARKIRFLEMVKDSLGLSNVEARCLDLGARGPDPLTEVDVIVSRAVSRPDALVSMTGHLLASAGVMVLMTGARNPENESDPGSVNLGGGFRLAAVHHVEIPGLDRSHEVTIVRHSDRA